MSNRSVAEAVVAVAVAADGGDGGGSGDEMVPFDDDSHNVAAAVVAWLYKTMPMRSLTSAVC